jgi:hypothetical protein
MLVLSTSLALAAGCSAVQHDAIPAGPGAGSADVLARPHAVSCSSLKPWNPNATPPQGLTVGAIGGVGKTGLPVTIVNKSGYSNGQIFLYATAINAVSGSAENGQYYYLKTDGSLQYFANGTAAPGFQLSCFPGSLGVKGKQQFVIPASAASGRLWIAIAPSAPLPGPASNPLPIVGVALPTPNPGAPTSPPGTPTVGVSEPAPWSVNNVIFDVVEYALAPAASPNLDLTQVDYMGLPLELQPNPGTPIGIEAANVPALVAKFKSDARFAPLLNYSTFDGQNTLTSIYSPKHLMTAQQLDSLDGYFNDYLEKVVMPAYEANMNPKSASYHTMWIQIEPLMTGIPLEASQKAYYVGYDAAAERFVFTPCTAGVCKAGAAGLASGEVSFSKNALSSINIFSNNQFTISAADPVYYLLKAMTTDLNRGVATLPGQHPAAPTSTQPFYSDKTPHSDYSEYMHEFALGHEAYGFGWDDCCGSFASSNDTSITSSVTGVTITIGPIQH